MGFSRQEYWSGVPLPSREWYTYIDVDGTGIGGEIEMQYGEDMEECLWKSFSHNPILSLSIQELDRRQMPKYVWKTARKNAQKPHYSTRETKGKIEADSWASSR